jgi:SAM-dependent methyltransferase
MDVRSVAHPLLPLLTPEDRSRQRTVVAMRRFLNTQVRPRNIARYEQEGAPAFAAEHGRSPQSPEDIREAFFKSRGYRLWSGANRAAQEMIWVSAGEPVMREAARMEETAAALIAAPGKRGALHLDPHTEPSAEVAAIDIHLQPGGYALTRSARDVMAGALYETGGNVFAFGQGLGKTDSKAGAIIAWLEGSHPAFKPTRILDIGCSAGAATAAYAAHYPDAEVHGGDIGAAMLRYAHARAEGLGVAVHFHQIDAHALPFPDGHFDLVVSHNLLHEIGREKRQAMIAEAARVLAPGGFAIHQDVPTRFEPTLPRQVERAWDTWFNGEAFWSIYAGDDLCADMAAAGFAEGRILELKLAKKDGIGDWYVLVGEKPI